MKTKHYVVEQTISQADLLDIKQAINNEEVVAIPTETVYGLSANAYNEQAVQKIYLAKGRPSDNPLIVHIADQNQLLDFVSEITPQVQQLMNAFWPGPITFILPLKPNQVAPSVNAGLTTIAVRMPQHPIALEIIKAAGVPLAAPSANRSGKPSPTTAQHVLHDFDGKIHSVIDAGHVEVGLESTVLDCTRSPMVIVRPGAITQRMLQEVLNQPVIYETSLINTQPIAPGMKYQHYAPHQPLTIVKASVAKFKNFLEQQSQQYKVGVLAFLEDAITLPNVTIYTIAQHDQDVKQANHQLYDALRYFDQTDCDVLYMRQFSVSDETMALHNRLSKASNQRYIEINDLI